MRGPFGLASTKAVSDDDDAITSSLARDGGALKGTGGRGARL